MWIAFFSLMTILGIYFLSKYLWKWSGGSEKIAVQPRIKEQKIKKYLTSDFKVKKKIKDGDPVKPYSIPDSNAVNFYEKNSYGGEGFLHKEYNKNLWEIINSNRDVSAIIVRTDKNEAHIKISYK